MAFILSYLKGNYMIYNELDLLTHPDMWPHGDQLPVLRRGLIRVYEKDAILKHWYGTITSGWRQRQKAKIVLPSPARSTTLFESVRLPNRFVRPETIEVE